MKISISIFFILLCFQLRAEVLSGKTIVIDPGHIGTSEWALVSKKYILTDEDQMITEGELTLELALVLSPLLKELGAEVFLTRSKLLPVADIKPEDGLSGDLKARYDYSISKKPQLFLSLHFDTIYKKDRAHYPNDSITQSAKVFITKDENALSFENSKELGQSITNEISSKLEIGIDERPGWWWDSDLHEDGVYGRELYLTKNFPDTTHALVEGFYYNQAQEVKNLVDPIKRSLRLKLLATAITNSVVQFFSD
ncbi:MAG: hypothetical protein HOE90_04445 [Bacteriovoracaceae bacterium]|jgi:N-acetylmuramoyl-L-alanine amidase|nr:hypothetical protein [Bacteriovoracaceae bacterium]